MRNKHSHKDKHHNPHQTDETLLQDNQDSIQESGLSDDDIASLVYMYQEEKMAMDLYDLFADEYDSQIFDKISDSEAKHQAAVEKLLVDNGVDIAALQDLSAGEFADEDLQNLYNTLAEQGMESYSDALSVGIAVEEADIADLTHYTASDVSVAVVGVYENLENGSEHHLSAFTNAMA